MEDRLTVTRPELAAAFNEWMHRYIADPAGFAREFESVLKFEAERLAGASHSYGDQCAAYLLSLIGVSEPEPSTDAA